MESSKLFVILLVGCCAFTVTFSLNSCFDTLIVSQQNVISVTNIIIELTNLNMMECISKCAFYQNCMTVFHRETTKDCVLYSQHMNNLVLVTAVGWRGFDVGTLDDPTRIPESPDPVTVQWVQAIGGFSSEWDENGYRAIEIIGPTNVYPAYGDLVGSYTPQYWSGPEWIHVIFSAPVFISRIEVYETFMAGGIQSVEVKKPDGSWDPVWTTPQLQKIEASRIEVVNFQINYVSNEVKITVDGSFADDTPELDAVKLSGWSSWTIP